MHQVDIEVEIEGVSARIGHGADAKTIAAVLRALKPDVSLDCRVAGRPPQGCRGIGCAGARTDVGRSLLGRRLCVPGKTSRSGEAGLFGMARVCVCLPNGWRMASSGGRACRMG
jgi:hypothetical protein